MADTSLNSREIFQLIENLDRNKGVYSTEPKILRELLERSCEAVEFLADGLSALTALQLDDGADAQEVKCSLWLTRNVVDSISAFDTLRSDLDFSLARRNGKPDGGDGGEGDVMPPEPRGRERQPYITLH